MSSASARRTPWLDIAEISEILFISVPPLALQPNSGDDESRFGELSDIVGDAVGEHRVSYELNNQRADERADDCGAATAKERAANRDCSDSVEFCVQPDLIGVAGGIDRDDDETG